MIRKATVDDSLNVAALSIQVWLHTYATDGMRKEIAGYVLKEFSPEAIARNIASEKLEYFLYIEEEHLLGYALLNREMTSPSGRTDLIEMSRLYVQEHHHGKGIGRQLLSAALGWCREHNMAGLWLKVYHKNLRAIDFYQYQGFAYHSDTWFELEGERHINHVYELDSL